MFSYYGSKGKIVDYYPPPKYDKIVEPFAGAAKYSLKYFYKDITIIDKYDVIIKIWRWLQKANTNDIDRLPHSLTRNDDLRNINFLCEEEMLLMKFIIAAGEATGRNIPSIRVDKEKINKSLDNIKNNLFKIKHWNIVHDSYDNIKNQESTWFIDPPYQYEVINTKNVIRV